jgi:L-alanine-DL-glutamate epimerase-like enolase superfamily enzyme
MAVSDGMCVAPSEPGIGVDWDWSTVSERSIPEFTREIRA